MVEIYKNISEFKEAIGIRGCLLSLDLGSKKIGIAICNPDRTIASPLTIVDGIKDKKFLNIIEEEAPVGIVVGWPLELSGNEGIACENTFKKCQEIINIVNLPIFLLDERFTTKIANNYLKEQNLKRKERNQVDDAYSAQALLQNFLSYN